MPSDDGQHAPRNGYRRLGALVTSDLVADEIEAAAALRGLRPLEVVNEVLASWAIKRRLGRRGPPRRPRST